MNLSNYSNKIQSSIYFISEMKDKDPESALKKCDKLQKEGEEANDDALIGYAHFTKAEIHYQLNEPVDFYVEMVTCMAPFERIQEWGYLAMANNMLGIMSLNRGNAPFAMDYYFKAMQYCQDHSLPDLMWIIRMNIGAVYYSIEEYDDALKFYKNAYLSISKENDEYNYEEDRVYAIVSIANTYLAAGNVDAAGSTYDRAAFAERDKYSLITNLIIDCFAARLYAAKGDAAEAERFIKAVHEEISSGITLMDVFDDIFSYLEMLLDKSYFDVFFFVMKRVLDIVSKTGLKNLEKKCLTLALKYFRITNDEQRYFEYAAKYFEIDEKLADENRLMVTNMIELRGSLHDLAKVNKEVEKENQLLNEKAETDPLTHLDNRFGLDRRRHEIYDRAIRENHSVAVEILDIDYFKQFNDNYGHQAGDRAIRFVSDNIKKLAGKDAIYAARFGGDEFIIIYEGYALQEVFSFAKELKNNIISAHFTHEYTLLPEKIITISQGIYYGFPTDSMKYKHFLHTADGLLYKAKLTKRNCIALSDSMDDDSKVLEA